MPKKWYEERRNGDTKDKINIAMLLSANFLLITLDLFTTKLALTHPYTYEAMPFGNNPFIEYPTIIGLTLILYLWEKRYHLRHIITPIYCFIIVIPIINNILIIIK